MLLFLFRSKVTPTQSFDFIHETITATNQLPTGEIERPVSSQSSRSEENNIAELHDSD